MYYYRAFGLFFETDIKFQTLEKMAADECRSNKVTIRAAQMPKSVVDTGDGGYRIGETYSFFHNRTMMMEIKNGTEIGYQLKAGGNPEYMKSYILGYGITMLCLQRKIITLHCSAVEHNGSAVLISGKSGSGKSTLTARLLSREYGFLADDIAAVVPDEQKVLVYPTFPYQKLCRDAALAQGYDLEQMSYIDEEKDKFLVSMEKQYIDYPVPVKAMVYLYTHDGESMECKKLEGMDKFGCIASNQFLQNLLGKDIFLPYIGQECLRIASKVDAYLIGRPLQGEAGEEIADFISRLVTIQNLI